MGIGRRVQPLQLGLRQLDIEPGQVGPQMVEPTCAEDRHDGPGPGAQPGQRDGGRCGAELFGDLVDRLDDVELVLGRTADEGGTCRVVDLRPAAVLAGQEAVLQRAPRHQRQALVECEWGHLGFDPAVEQRVADLQGHQRRPALQQCPCLGLRGHPGGDVGEPQVPDLARVNEVVEGAHGLLDRSVPVPVVQPVQVDVVGAQPAQALLELGDDRASACAATVGVAGEHVGEELGGQNDTIAPVRVRGEVVTEDFLGVSVGVEVGGVDEVAAVVEIAGDDGRGFLGAAAGAAGIFTEGHGAQCEWTDTQAGTAQGDVMVERHRSSP